MTGNSKSHRDSHIPFCYHSKVAQAVLVLEEACKVLLGLCKEKQCLVLWETKQLKYLGLKVAGRHGCSFSVIRKTKPVL